MVRAILDGRKTQTRRVLRESRHASPENDGSCSRCGLDVTNGTTCPPGFAQCIYGEPGDRLWVREEHYVRGHWESAPGARTKTGRMKWRFVAADDVVRFDAPAEYRKGRHHKDPGTVAWHKRLARFMPRVLSRTMLEVVSVRVERLHDITEADARAEGIETVSLREEWHAVRVRADGTREMADFDHQPSAAVARELQLEDVRHVPARELFTPRKAFERLWGSINGDGSWDANPWVWAITFRRVEA